MFKAFVCTIRKLCRRGIPASSYLFKFNKRYTGKKCDICSKLTSFSGVSLNKLMLAGIRTLSYRIFFGFVIFHASHNISINFTNTLNVLRMKFFETFSKNHHLRKLEVVFPSDTQSTFTCSKLKRETPEQCVKYSQS